MEKNEKHPSHLDSQRGEALLDLLIERLLNDPSLVENQQPGLTSVHLQQTAPIESHATTHKRERSPLQELLIAIRRHMIRLDYDAALNTFIEAFRLTPAGAASPHQPSFQDLIMYLNYLGEKLLASKDLIKAFILFQNAQDAMRHFYEKQPLLYPLMGQISHNLAYCHQQNQMDTIALGQYIESLKIHTLILKSHQRTRFFSDYKKNPQWLNDTQEACQAIFNKHKTPSGYHPFTTQKIELDALAIQLENLLDEKRDRSLYPIPNTTISAGLTTTDMPMSTSVLQKEASIPLALEGTGKNLRNMR